MSDKAIQSNQTESSDGSGLAAVGEACDEYNPFLKRRKVIFVKPGEYDPYEEGLFDDEGGWRYDPTGAFGRWTSSHLPPKVGQGNALAEKLLEAEEGAGDLPLVIHDSLQQLRTQLLGDEKQQQQQHVISDDDYGQVCEAQLLESTCITITTPSPSESGHGTAAYQIERYSVPTEPELPQCIGVNTQLNGQSSEGTTVIPTSVQQSLSSRIGKFLKHT